MPPGLLPEHKAAVVLFMERVYGLSDADTFVRLLENAFLPDMRAVTLLDSVSVHDIHLNASISLLNAFRSLLKGATRCNGERHDSCAQSLHLWICPATPHPLCALPGGQ